MKIAATACMDVMRRVCILLAMTMLLGGALQALAAGSGPQPIVIGQSLPLTGPGFPIANRVLNGAKAMVDRVNASGGVLGRPLELVTLDDGGDPKRLSANLRTLVERNKAVAIVSCLGERACIEAAVTTRDLRVPLIGPISGALALRSPSVRHVYSLRPDDAKEAAALANQLLSIGITRAVLLADEAEPSRTETLAAALQRIGLQVTRIKTDERPASIEAAFRGIVKAEPQALVLNVGTAVLDSIGRLPTGTRNGVPMTIATLSSAGLTQVTRTFRDRVVGYTSVVPNPELINLSIVRDLQRDADEFVGPEAVSFEGLEAYMSMRLCTIALRRVGRQVDGQHLSESIEGLGRMDMGGLQLTFGPERHHGSDFIEIGMRGRDGRMLR